MTACALLLTVRDGRGVEVSARLPPTPEPARDRVDLGTLTAGNGGVLAGRYRYADADGDLACALDYDIASLDGVDACARLTQ